MLIGLNDTKGTWGKVALGKAGVYGGGGDGIDFPKNDCGGG